VQRAPGWHQSHLVGIKATHPSQLLLDVTLDTLCDAARLVLEQHPSLSTTAHRREHHKCQHPSEIANAAHLVVWGRVRV